MDSAFQVLLPFFFICQMHQRHTESENLRTFRKKIEMASIKVKEEPKDLISKLPTSLLRSIISFLPVEDAVRTSIIAKQWESLWKSTTHLDFDLRRLTKESREFFDSLEQHKGAAVPMNKIEFEAKLLISDASKIVNKIFWNLQGDITSCRIVFPLCKTDYVMLRKWINHLRRGNKLQKLALIRERFTHFNGSSCGFMLNEDKELPYVVFSFETLHILELTNFRLGNNSPFEGCKNIRTLKLNSVVFGDGVMDETICNLKLLEKLSLSSCIVIKKLKICNQNLIVLELQALTVTEVEICAEKLSILVIDSIICPVRSMAINTPNLKVFRAYCNSEEMVTLCEQTFKCLNPSEILEYCSGLLESHQRGSDQLGCDHIFCTTPLENLQELAISLDLNNIREAVILAYILRVCIHIRKLVIIIKGKKDSQSRIKEYSWRRKDGPENKCYQEKKDISDPTDNRSLLPYPEGEFWDRTELSNSISNHLKFVEISGYEGNAQEFKFVEHLITNATVMERIIIHSYGNSSKDGGEMAAMVDLLSLPKASINASVVLKSGNVVKKA